MNRTQQAFYKYETTIVDKCWEGEKGQMLRNTEFMLNSNFRQIVRCVLLSALDISVSLRSESGIRGE